MEGGELATITQEKRFVYKKQFFRQTMRFYVEQQDWFWLVL